MICARVILSSRSPISASTWPWRSLAAWYSAFSVIVAASACLLDRLDDPGPLLAQRFQLGRQLFVAFRQHRHFYAAILVTTFLSSRTRKSAPPSCGTDQSAKFREGAF